MHNSRIALLLLCSVSAPAAEKTHLDLEWREEPKNEKADFMLKWREAPKAETPEATSKWQQAPTAEGENEQSYAFRHNQYTRPYSSGRVHRSNRQRVIDPNFSSFTSDGGYIPEMPSDFHSDFHANSDSFSSSYTWKY